MEYIKNLKYLNGKFETSSIKYEEDDGTISFIPLDKSNVEYQKYLLWIDSDIVNNIPHEFVLSDD